ncbi:hypothetical protein [Dolichospermum circinale]|uniref:Uncharacterized protein n=1 Tax=Dolichospermum circinale CS-537/01 TaxID=3021739 RepID=A0ABT4ZZA7_9CYAN|nr:hypothetical protein [Dolichospermum circinale]MDB9484998.1 hypothetical protein [Dolichospermum circinale CS-537/01]
MKNGPSQNISFQSLFLVILYSREQGTGNREQGTGNRGAEEKIFPTDNGQRTTDN